MTLEIIIFFLLAFGVLVTSLLVISFKNPINSAISLVVSFLCMAGVYALLNAPFMAVIQIMVYAGAIMVLFLFVIMLLNLSDEELGEPRVTLTKIVSGLVVVGMCWGFISGISTIQLTGDVETTEADKGKTISQVLGDNGQPFSKAEVERWVLVDGRMVLDGDKLLEGGEVLTVGKSRYSEQGLSRAVASPSTDDIKFVAGIQAPQYDEDGKEVERPEPTPAEQKLLDKQRARVKSHLLLWDEFGSIEAVGKRLYTKWVFPFEVTALLLLAAIVGAVVMAKRRL